MVQRRSRIKLAKRGRGGGESQSIATGCIERFVGSRMPVLSGGCTNKGRVRSSFREEALKTHRIGTKIPREIANIRGRRMVFVEEEHDFSDPSWRVSYSDGDWE